jgi:hypothetical protein
MTTAAVHVDDYCCGGDSSPTHPHLHYSRPRSRKKAVVVAGKDRNGRCGLVGAEDGYPCCYC